MSYYSKKFFELKDFIYGTFYKNFVKVHWKPRAKEIDFYIKYLLMEQKEKFRIIDFGSGEGSLAFIAMDNEIEYLGIDQNFKLTQTARVRHQDKKNVQFIHGSVGELRQNITKNDIICLNGVAHHLPDDVFLDLLDVATCCKGIVILDHMKVKFFENPLAWLLQKLDFGKFVREYAVFQDLPNLKVSKNDEFSVCFFGITFWPHFIVFYNSVKN